MTLWVGQDGTLNDDDGDGAAAPGSADGDDTSVDAGDANAAAMDQDDTGDATDVADGEEVVEVADDQPLASVYESTAIFEPSMYLPGEVVLYSGHPYFTRRYYERIGLPVRGLRAGRRPGFFERLFGHRRAVARPWTQGLVELRRLYPGRSDVELLELHRRYPGREREMLEARVHADAHGIQLTGVQVRIRTKAMAHRMALRASITVILITRGKARSTLRAAVVEDASDAHATAAWGTTSEGSCDATAARHVRHVHGVGLPAHGLRRGSLHRRARCVLGLDDHRAVAARGASVEPHPADVAAAVAARDDRRRGAVARGHRAERPRIP